jgi:2-oxo-4-hydroxy-4-carboxy-5-ureidoimidazoline decarboxylase
LNTLTQDEMDEFTALNTSYKAKFGFPFILAVRNATKYTILDAFRSRINNTAPLEFAQCMSQIHKIAWMRLLSKLEWNSKGFLTCHVLDTAQGCPAAGMRITLSRRDMTDAGEVSTVIKTFVTNDDGRTGRALDGADFAPGTYEWTFHCGPYFAKSGLYTSGTPFLDDVPIRFGIDNPEDHYHVPLLVSPWSFSTYRGS